MISLVDGLFYRKREYWKAETWWQLWLIWVVVIVAATTMPWSNYVGHSHWGLVGWLLFYDHPLALSDVLTNVVLFIPFGFLLRRALPRSSPKGVWLFTLLTAVVLSTSVEFFQVYCHNRHPSTTDIGANLLGAVVGLNAVITGLIDQTWDPLAR